MNYNKMMLAGRLAVEPELRYTPAQKAVCDIRLAFDEGYGEKKTTLFVDVTCWDKTAENVSKHFRKGDPIFLEGRLTQDTWVDKASGLKRHKFKMLAYSFAFCGEQKKRQGERAPEEKVDIRGEEVPF